MPTKKVSVKVKPSGSKVKSRPVRARKKVGPAELWAFAEQFSEKCRATSLEVCTNNKCRYKKACQSIRCGSPVSWPNEEEVLKAMNLWPNKRVKK